MPETISSIGRRFYHSSVPTGEEPIYQATDLFFLRAALHYDVCTETLSCVRQFVELFGFEQEAIFDKSYALQNTTGDRTFKESAASSCRGCTSVRAGM